MSQPTQKPPRLRIFLADDHPVVRAGLKTMINAEGDMEVVGEAKSGPEALERIVGLPLDVAVLDISMPGLSGAQVARQLMSSPAGPKVLMLTVHEDGAYLRQILQAGAAGYLLKRAAGNELIQAIRAVAAGETYIDPRLSGSLLGTLVEPPARTVPAKTGLSERETEVISLIAQGYTNKEVGGKLGLSAKTIETYKGRSMEKLGLRGRVELVRVAIQRGWIRNSARPKESGDPEEPGRDRWERR